MTETLLLAGIALAGGLWHGGRAAAERAYAAAAAACEDMRLQLLDDSVSLARLSLARHENGWLTLRREYRFEFCTANTERRQGLVLLLGGTLEYVHLGTPEQPVIVQPGATDGASGGTEAAAGAAPETRARGGQVIPFPQRRSPH
jgi:hypothetical protein